MPVPLQLSFALFHNHSLALNRGNGLLALLDPTSTLVFEQWIARLSAGEIAARFAEESGEPVARIQRDIERLVDDWATCGLLDAVPVSESPRVSVFHGNAEFETTLRLNYCAIRVRSWLESGGRAVLDRLAHRWSEESTAQTVVDLRPEAEGMSLWSDGEYVCTSPDLNEGSGHLYELLLSLDCEARQPLVFVHAGCVVRKGKCALLCGTSGSGKTTLTAALAAAGADYLGDELSVVDARDWSVRSLPTCFSVKWKGRGVFAEITGRSVPAEERGVWNVDPTGFARPATVAAAPATLFFPKYRAGSQLVVARLDPVEVLGRLLQGGLSFGVLPGDPDLSGLLRWIDRSEGFALTFGTTRDGVRAVHEILDARS